VIERAALPAILVIAVLVTGCGRTQVNRDRAQAPASGDSGVVRAPAVDSTEVLLPGRGQHLIQDWQVDDLRRQGVADPVPTLVADLQRHPKLIPYEGVLGGTMGFYDSTQIHVLNDRWVYAYFEDGHVSGYGLFEYSIGDSGQIEWKRVKEFMAD
jgi:hypothetical protein